jgi:hypothetical protein
VAFFWSCFVLSSLDRLVCFFDRSSRVRPGSRSLFLASDPPCQPLRRLGRRGLTSTTTSTATSKVMATLRQNVTVCHHMSPSSQPTPSGLSESMVDALQVRRTLLLAPSFAFFSWGARKEGSCRATPGKRVRRDESIGPPEKDPQAVRQASDQFRKSTRNALQAPSQLRISCLANPDLIFSTSHFFSGSRFRN